MRRPAAAAASLAVALANPTIAEPSAARATHPYVGMWVTGDGRVRHELLPDGRYDEARGTRESAYRGRYEVTGSHIEYWDDTGFRADGDFVDADTLHHGGMVLRRRPQRRAPSQVPDQAPSRPGRRPVRAVSSSTISERHDAVTSSISTRPFARTARGLLVALALVATAAPAQASTASSDAAAQTRNEGIVRRAFEGWAAGGGVFAELLAPDVVWTIHGSGPVAGTYRGREDFVERASRPLVSRLATPLVPRVHHLWAVGDTVIVRFEAAATTTSGDAYSNQFVWIFRMRDGAVVEAEAFLDLVAYQQVLDTSEPHRQ